MTREPTGLALVKECDDIELLLEGRYPDPDGGGCLGIPIRSIVLEDTFAGHEADLAREAGISGTLAVVSDRNTHAAMGARVTRSLSALGRITPVDLGDGVHADAETAAAVEERTRGCDALVAVGSGTINDLCKYVAARADKPYVVFATAPSMNGYTSANAAITIDGHKKSVAAAAPAGVFIDLGVLAAAPPRLIRAGLGDSICRTTAQVDWLLSHHLLGTPYRSAPFALLAADEPALLEESAALVRGDLSTMRRLARTLVLSGIGMTLSGGSYPASQGEHLISHYIDMMAPPGRPDVFHGEQIAVTTLTMARLQERFIQADRPPLLGPTTVTREDVIAHFGPGTGDTCWREFEQKILTPQSVDGFNARLAASWDDFVHACESIMVKSYELRAVLAAAGAPTDAASIALDCGFYTGAVRHARELRNRYTFLDLAADACPPDRRMRM